MSSSPKPLRSPSYALRSKFTEFIHHPMAFAVLVFWLVASLLGVPSPASTDSLFSYQDSAGKTHYVDRIEKIPPEFRDRSKGEADFPRLSRSPKVDYKSPPPAAPASHTQAMGAKKTEETEDELTEQERQPREKSSIAAEIERLKKASFNAASERERVPQPLFWSLFNSQIRELKKEKKALRALEEILGPKL